ncbi:MAG TPA: PilZ domain-containing protein [Anaeromyxobacteraceae bacterium]|nr:PilZ domain-containing protein [Anaeromyxobacteraceae bacterium]
MADTTRRYERIDVELPCRLFVPGDGALRFEAYARSRNLGLGGLFVSSTFLLPEGLELFAELSLPSGPLAIRSRVAHSGGLADEDRESGMGIEFLEVNARGRETLLRYFSPLRYQRFFANMVAEFPHLKKELPLDGVSLVLNLWEEWKIRADGGPEAIRSGAPPAPPRAAGRRRRGPASQ